ncbi:phosphatidate phosphatase [Starmerella bacillaris]|uniref:Phosphatidate phosphatase n=1 Tax=Starmerella bacillaris TaxID=1247836 RepID=A0AAV5RDK3_STABA|nr:phosphatidate phosphatase [Starmerella bacillaris]
MAQYIQESSFFSWSRNQITYESQICLYEGYSREIPNSSFKYEGLVRGWFYQPQATRKSRIMRIAIEKLVGNPGKYSSIEDAVQESSLEKNNALLDLDSPGMSDTFDEVKSSHSVSEAFTSNVRDTSDMQAAQDNNSSTSLGIQSIGKPFIKRTAGVFKDQWSGQKSKESPQSPPAQRNLLRERLVPISHKSLITKDVQVIIESAKDSYGHREQRTFWAFTDDTGRFSQKCRVPFKPERVTVYADDAKASSDFIFIPPVGISIISDVDDTVRHSGVTKSKRELLQNILAKGFDDCKIDGVSEWYNEMAQSGAAFHYVSNSPWQLYHIVEGFLQHHGFPEGTIHLKRYAGIIEGITEPVRGRKRATLESIIQDFPLRKFIMVGDSGEADLEAYSEMALKFPDQIAAIYIRDITLSRGDNLDLQSNRSITSQERYRYGMRNLIDFSPETYSVDGKSSSKEQNGGLSVRSSISSLSTSSGNSEYFTKSDDCKTFESIRGSTGTVDLIQMNDAKAINAVQDPPVIPPRRGLAKFTMADDVNKSQSLPNIPKRKPVPIAQTNDQKLDSIKLPILEPEHVLIQLAEQRSNEDRVIVAEKAASKSQPKLPPKPVLKYDAMQTATQKLSDTKLPSPIPRDQLPPKPKLRQETKAFIASRNDKSNSITRSSETEAFDTFRNTDDVNDNKLTDFSKRPGEKRDINDGKPELPPRRKLLERTSSKLMESAYSVASASSTAVSRILGPAGTPSEGLKNNNPTTNLTNSEPQLSKNTDSITPPLPPRKSSQNKQDEGLKTNKSWSRFEFMDKLPTFDLESHFVPSSQDIVDADKIDKRAESWKMRIYDHRRLLPNTVSLKTWKVPDDVKAESLRLIKLERGSLDILK